MNKPHDDKFDLYLKIDVTAAELRRMTSIMNTVITSFFRDDLGRASNEVFNKHIGKTSIDDLLFLSERTKELGCEMEALMDEWDKLAPFARPRDTAKSNLV